VQSANYFSLCTLHFALEQVAKAIRLPNLDLIRDIAKVVGFLLEAEYKKFS